ncbi:hypothetical protein SADUNF_Sadunf06G0084300 [Salix dunnii]|uniref:Uncharacterized protein n=1 Tax=Salix dunnii TaxID=1413687 RepID=A0A835MV64_9ROSI|nr:hypothetical protein SADUNF_Sadunf06G0084300 [Salix dunnii]
MRGFEDTMSVMMSVMLRKSIRFFQEVALVLMNVFSQWVSAIRYNSSSLSQLSTTPILRRSGRIRNGYSLM